MPCAKLSDTNPEIAYVQVCTRWTFGHTDLLADTELQGDLRSTNNEIHGVFNSWSN